MGHSLVELEIMPKFLFLSPQVLAHREERERERERERQERICLNAHNMNVHKWIGVRSRQEKSLIINTFSSNLELFGV
jgi:hypothetical protein